MQGQAVSSPIIEDGYDSDDWVHPDCRCDGSGVIMVCCDDMCRGAGECIHGDGMKVCPCESP